jgi:hypothetical protein
VLAERHLSYLHLLDGLDLADLQVVVAETAGEDAARR